VAARRDFPISLSVGNDASVTFEPRNLKRVPDLDRERGDNAELLGLRKGAEYPFRGKLIYCDYYFRSRNDVRFMFKVEGDSPNAIDAMNLRSAIGSGLFGVIVGAIGGLAFGAAAYNPSLGSRSLSRRKGSGHCALCVTRCDNGILSELLGNSSLMAAHSRSPMPNVLLKCSGAPQCHWRQSRDNRQPNTEIGGKVSL